jgi:phenylalanyl-tRNA synthetase beta chain
MIKAIKEVNPKTIKAVVPFDEFKGKQIKEGHRSLTLAISLGSEAKTLTDEQIKITMDRVVARLIDLFKIEMR